MTDEAVVSGQGTNRSDSRAHRRYASLTVVLFVATVSIAGLSAAIPVSAAAEGDRPTTFLEGASVPRAKGLALDAALIKGWRVAETERTYVIFETTLEEPASRGPPNAVVPDRTLLRIRADFVSTPAGVNTYLYAEEVWYAGSSKEWSTNVTHNYWANLTNALASLQTQWAKTAKTRPLKPPANATSAREAPSDRALDTPTTAADADQAAAPSMGTSQPKVRTAPISPSPALPAAPTMPTQQPGQPRRPAIVDIEVGTWAYHAEEFAVARGCSLDEIGAELVSGDSSSELHRVHCENGSSVLVRCDRERCVDAR